ncbi:uncharacterized protein LOC131663591 [Phymastichus coffea]|uniref:uncharacterized protein LOC131663591 n=1 Tax=Phymastichus coffea TaxID=108790 RepID=UPI00273B847A|nr:uncharacterized protein LOC131663591 [Phymastichus coffea]
MNTLTVFLLLCAVVVTKVQANIPKSKFNPELKNVWDKCTKEAKLTEAELDIVLENYSKITDQRVKCLKGCLFKSLHVINIDNKVNETAAEKYYEGVTTKKETINEAIQKCIPKATGNDHCDIAQNFESCLCSEYIKCS